MSKDVDVSLWVESRNFNNEPPLREILDFVIVTRSLHAQFDEFKKKETQFDYSILPLNELLEFWNNPPLPLVTMYGKPHAKLHYKDMDQLCEWVIDQRKKRVSVYICCSRI